MAITYRINVWNENEQYFLKNTALNVLNAEKFVQKKVVELMQLRSKIYSTNSSDFTSKAKMNHHRIPP